MAHLYGKINKEDLNSEKSYSKIACYCQSKLANVLFTKELAKRLKGTGVTVNALHPGTVDTELSRHVDKISIFFNKYLMKPLLFLFYKTPNAGCQTTLYAALDPELNNVTGKYFA
jgi:NAD(P)-dependent dehydrogenase (short-subunit alcohol dehydrogenase family)